MMQEDKSTLVCHNPIHGKSCSCTIEKCYDCGRYEVIPHHLQQSKMKKVRDR